VVVVAVRVVVSVVVVVADGVVVGVAVVVGVVVGVAVAMTYAEILAELRTFETTQFRSEPELKEQLVTQTYDAVVALLTKLAEHV
jgi:hypothetical protein